MLMRRLAAWQVVAQKTDEWLNGTLDLLPRGTNAATLVSCVARQRFTHHVHERQIPGEEGRATVSAKYCLQATVKLTRFRGHRTVWVQGVHDGQDKIALRT